VALSFISKDISPSVVRETSWKSYMSV